MMTPERPQRGPAAAKPGDPPPAPPSSETGAFHQDATTDAAPAPVPWAAADWVGKVLGKYRVTGILGQGGMGVVLRAHDPVIEQDVAIKVLAGHPAGDASALSRFLAEARAA